MSENIIQLENVSVAFDGEKVLDNLSLSIKDKEFVTLLGPSGCGKTTTLRIIAGFIEPDSGNLYFDGKRINDIPPYKRQVNTVFQRYALFPHLNVFENIAFGLRLKKMPDAEIRKKVFDMLELVNLKGYASRKVGNLSGGQQQRVAIARAVAAKPVIILADEPTGNLDSATSHEVLGLLKMAARQFSQTIILITHDRDIAQLADRIVHIEDGKIVGNTGKGSELHA